MRAASPVAIASLFALLIAALSGGCAAGPPAAGIEKIDRILTLIDQRLGFMDDVARNKWNSGAAIEDLPREREIINGIGNQAAAYGLDATIAMDFFRAQIEASKIIQNARFADWRARNQPPFEKLSDLRQRIRPALDALTPEMMTALAAALPVLRTPGAAALLDVRSAPPGVNAANLRARQTAIAPLRELARAE